MEAKLTARQNEIISEILGKIALERFNQGSLALDLGAFREILVAQFKAISAETSCY